MIGDARTNLDETYRTREVALMHGRALTRTCANAIRAMHRGELAEAREAISGARAEARQVAEALASHPGLFFAGYVQDAHKELAEAAVLLALLEGAPLPTPVALGIETAAYLNGLAEAASEGRRHALDCLRRGEAARAEMMLAAMDDILSALMTLDYPDAVTGGLRRTCDSLRGVVERTRGDVTMAVLQKRLLSALPNAGG
ncbi:MAG: haloacid dehalogenase [Cytophagales bacterium]|nr:haloacid dehalogenase [Armatimonadota bacterium]